MLERFGDVAGFVGRPRNAAVEKGAVYRAAVVIPGRVEDANPESRDSGFDAIRIAPE